MFVCRLLNVPTTCECISGTDLLRQVYGRKEKKMVVSVVVVKEVMVFAAAAAAVAVFRQRQIFSPLTRRGEVPFHSYKFFVFFHSRCRPQQIYVTSGTRAHGGIYFRP